MTEYVRSCQESFIPPNPSSIGTSMVPAYPWEVIFIDLMGPYPKGTNRNQYFFVVVDCFTKFVELFPLRKATSAAVIQKLWQLCCRWGFPKVIVSDNGTQFTSKDYTIWCKTFGITPFHISPYHAQANMTERYNRTIKKMIIASIDRMKDWDNHLDELSFALRTCVSDATSMTPSYLSTGRGIHFRDPYDPASVVVSVSPGEKRRCEVQQMVPQTAPSRSPILYTWMENDEDPSHLHLETEELDDDFAVRASKLTEHEIVDFSLHPGTHLNGLGLGSSIPQLF